MNSNKLVDISLWSIEEATCESSWPLPMVFCLTWIVIRMKL